MLNDNQPVTNILPLSETLLSCDKSIRNSSSCSLELLDALVSPSYWGLYCMGNGFVLSSAKNTDAPRCSQVLTRISTRWFHALVVVVVLLSSTFTVDCEQSPLFGEDYRASEKEKMIDVSKAHSKKSAQCTNATFIFFPRLFSWLARQTSPKRREVLVV